MNESLNILNKLTETNIMNIDVIIYTFIYIYILIFKKISSSLEYVKESFAEETEKFADIRNDLEKVSMKFAEKQNDQNIKLEYIENLCYRNKENIDILFEDRGGNFMGKDGDTTDQNNNPLIRGSGTGRGIENNLMDISNKIVNESGGDLNEKSISQGEKKNFSMHRSQVKDGGDSKEISILKSNFEMQLSILRNEIKKSLKVTEDKQKELSTLFDKNLKIIHKNSDKNKVEEKDGVNIVKGPIFDEDNKGKDSLRNKKDLKSSIEIDVSINALRKINEKIDEYQERLIKIENFNKSVKKRQNSKDKNEDEENNNVKIDFSSNSLENQKMLKDLTNNNFFNKFIEEKIQSENEIYQKLFEDITANKEELNRHNIDINKIYESILALRNLIGEKNDDEENLIGRNLNELQLNFTKFSEKFEKKVNDNDKILKKLKEIIEDSTKGLIEREENGGNNLREFFVHLLKKTQTMNEKLEKNSIKLDNFSGEIINKLKKDLTCN